jgi:hypothetical protein
MPRHPPFDKQWRERSGPPTADPAPEHPTGSRPGPDYDLG